MIPKAVREHFGLKTGDRVKFFIHPDGSVAFLPSQPVSIERVELYWKKCTSAHFDKQK
jgi:AbrB family looped-hinge helix DNA binding protein